MNSAGKVHVHALVYGRVQGVGFRYFVRQTAAEFSISGWVRNLADGRVELSAEGTQLELEDFIGALKRGPSSSNVSHLELDWGKANGEFSGFVIRPTGQEPTAL